MHAAPSVTYPVGRSRLGGWLLLACWAAGAAVSLLWAWQAGAPGWRHALGLVASAACGWLAWCLWRAAPAGELSWDGARWTWIGPGSAGTGHLRVGLDLQGLLLVRWQGGAGAHWLWLDRSAAPHRWGDLRRAVYSRARPPALHGSEAPAAKT